MKKFMWVFAAVCVLLAGCAGAVSPAETTVGTEIATAATEATTQQTVAETTQEAAGLTINPLAIDGTENLTDATVAVSLEEGGVYTDDAGTVQMKVKVWDYDKYDMVDVAMLKVGDTIVTHFGDVAITALEQDDAGTISINGGPEAGGIALVTEETGIFYEVDATGAKKWYEAGEVTIPVSADFQGQDGLTADSFLKGEVTDYDFTPYNTTIRVEGGQVVELTRAAAE